MSVWRSKLGQDFDKSYIEGNERVFREELNSLRKLPENRTCADCDTEGTVWASVNIGVFLCLRCGSLHRGLGTHISVPKGCTGTYLWGPDELEQMRSKGNGYARIVYGGQEHKPHPSASDDIWRQYIRDKYELRRWVSAPGANGRYSDGNPASHLEDKRTEIIEDLISFDCIVQEKAEPASSAPDFFAEFGFV